MILTLWLIAIIRHLFDGPALRRAEQRAQEAGEQAARAEEGRRAALAHVGRLEQELVALRSDVGRQSTSEVAGLAEGPTRPFGEALDAWREENAEALAALHREEMAEAAAVGDRPRTVLDAVADWQITEARGALNRSAEPEQAAPTPRTAGDARRPRVGIGVLLRRRFDGALLFGLRQGAHGAGTWSVPGGHLEPNESIIEGAVREIEEESGIGADELARVEVLGVFTHDRHIGPVPYLTVYVVAETTSGRVPQIREPDKCAGWRWVRPNDPKPEPLFGPIQRLIAQGIDPHTAHLTPRIDP